MKCGEERKDWKTQEKKKLRKERYKNNEDLTRKSKVCGSCDMRLLSSKKVVLNSNFLSLQITLVTIFSDF